MEIKYAIYKNKIGLSARYYVDSAKLLEDHRAASRISLNRLPVVISYAGGYMPFDANDKDFVKIVEVDECVEPLTREDIYPKNAKNFVYGWISPNGDTYHTGHAGHGEGATAICEELGLGGFGFGESLLEERKWIKITGSWEKGSLVKCVIGNGLSITKKQADTLFDLGLYELQSVKYMVEYSENNW